MLTSFWRYSHLFLAVSSFCFILCASITGIILALEPIYYGTKPYKISNFNEIQLGKTLEAIDENFNEVLELKIDSNNFLIVDGITNSNESIYGYINPNSGEILGNYVNRPQIFKSTTNLHRSLFLKSTGRIIVGIASFFLFLITISGIVLIAKRQLGVKHFFSKIKYEYFNQYWHVSLGRISLIPIIIVSLTGVYLSLNRFNVITDQTTSNQINFKTLKTSPKRHIKDFAGLKDILLKDVVSVEYPFSKDVEDFYIIKLKNKEIILNQITGDVVSETSASITSKISYWSIILHTGAGSIFWACVLLLSCIGLLFFIYSGFSMTYKKSRKSRLPKNKFKKNACEYVILVGSETGNTMAFAKTFYKALIDCEKKVYITQLNNFTVFQNLRHLIIFTSTYGNGEAPSNAKNFIKLFNKWNTAKNINYSIVGFGSLAYPLYCKYAEDVDQIISKKSNYHKDFELYKINNSSFKAFNDWAKQWGALKHLNIILKAPEKQGAIKKVQKFTVIGKTKTNNDDVFLLTLKPKKNVAFTSGDLLSLIPKNETRTRLYSIGKIDNNILLSIKKHRYGICSNFLNQLQVNDVLEATIEKNKTFHFPKKTTEVIMIANGTGIAPFLGMLHEKKDNVKKHLFWGGPTENSFDIYKSYVLQAREFQQLESLNLAYSREEQSKKYVQDLLPNYKSQLIHVLKNNGTIMICGSVGMQTDVLKTIYALCFNELHLSIHELKKKNKIKMDCY